MTLSKDFYRNIEKIANKAKHTSSKQQVFKDLIQVGFNSMLDPRVRLQMPYFSSGWDDALRVELTAYKTQPEAWNLLSETCLMWFEAIKAGEPFEDILGSSYDEHLGKELGQFFTPSDVASILAELNLAGSHDRIKAKLDANEPWTIGDTMGCGSGSLLMATLRKVHSSFGDEAMRQVFVAGQDLDSSMVQLAATQIFYSSVWHGAPLGGMVVYWGNALTEPMERPGFWSLFGPELPWSHRLIARPQSTVVASPSCELEEVL